MYIYEDFTIPLYFYSSSKIALIEILIELGTVTNGDLQLKVSEWPKKIAECLGLHFFIYPGIENVNIQRLAKWLDPQAPDRVSACN